MPSHQERREPLPKDYQALIPRVRSKIAVDDATGCWLWTASRAQGYGQIWVGGSRFYAHRYVYEKLVGPIPVELQIDHLCRVRHCVNPDHLEPVTQRVNLLRGDTFAAKQAIQTHCKRGHVFDALNTQINGRHRKCKACANERRRKHQLSETVVSQNAGEAYA